MIYIMNFILSQENQFCDVNWNVQFMKLILLKSHFVPVTGVKAFNLDSILFSVKMLPNWEEKN